MADPRGSVTIGSGPGLTLVAEVGQYKPFGEELALGVTAFDGVDDVTIQDFGFRADRQTGTLSSGTGESAGLISKSTLASLITLLTAWGVSQTFSDSAGNTGTIKALRFTHAREYGVPTSQDSLFSYTLTWRWVTLTQLYGTAYSGP